MLSRSELSGSRVGSLGSNLLCETYARAAAGLTSTRHATAKQPATVSSASVARDNGMRYPTTRHADLALRIIAVLLACGCGGGYMPRTVAGARSSAHQGQLQQAYALDMDEETSASAP